MDHRTEQRGWTGRGGGRRAPRRLWTLAAALACAVAAALPAPAQEPSLPQVLARATEHVEALHAALSGVVMEERYEQRASTPGFGRFGTDAYERVTLRSDYLLVQPEGSERYFGFRDVFEANGSAVRDRGERLTELFLGGASTLDRQVQGILSDSARYNVGDVQRNTNTPTLALLFLRGSYKPRFAFERVEDRAPGLGIDEPEGADVWVIAYRETWPTSVVRQRRGGNLPASGRYWIEPATGRVLVTEVAFGDGELDSLVTVRYAQPEALEHLAPVEMRERYNNRRSRSRVEGTATYSRFRRFRVVVDESEPFRD